ncbi:purine permease, partial [Clostridium perfringens]
VELNRHEYLFIISCSVVMGRGVTAVPGLFASLHDKLRILADNGNVAGSLTAIVLNLIFNG